MTTHLQIRVQWEVQGNRLVCPSGTTVAIWEDGALYLYDKRTRISWPFTIEDFKQLANKNGLDNDHSK